MKCAGIRRTVRFRFVAELAILWNSSPLRGRVSPLWHLFRVGGRCLAYISLLNLSCTPPKRGTRYYPTPRCALFAVQRGAQGSFFGVTIT